jgi:hypothetical protein
MDNINEKTQQAAREQSVNMVATKSLSEPTYRDWKDGKTSSEKSH